MIRLENIIKGLFKKSEKTAAVKDIRSGDDTVTYVIVVDNLPAAEDALVNYLYVLKTTNELWIVYDGSNVWSAVVPFDVYETSEDAEAASLLYPNKICFVVQ